MTARKFAGGDLSSWNTSKVTTMQECSHAEIPPSANVFNGDVSTWDVSSVTDMTNMFIRAGAFNQDISSWSTSKVTDMKYMFKGATAFYQDITGWTTTSLTTSTGMFTGATAWLDRVQRGDGTGTSTDGPISDVGPQAVPGNERVQSGWCVPCGGGGIRPAGDDPSSGDTMCAFPDKPRSRTRSTRASRRCRAARRAARRTRTARIRARRGAGARAAWICRSGTCRW